MILAFVKRAFEKLNARDKRMLKFGVIAALVILVCGLAIVPWFSRWAKVRARLSREKTKLTQLSMAGGTAGLAKIVPAFEMPKSEDKQRLVFESRFSEQLKKAGIQVKTFGFVSRAKRQSSTGFKLLYLQCRGKCDFAQLLDLLAGLNENPYLVAVEDLRITCNEKNRKEIEMDLTVSTFCK